MKLTRPTKFDDIVGQEHIVEVFKNKRDIPHCLFIGPPGVGKTSLAYVIANELKYEIVELNASDERGIEVVRSKVKKYAFSTGRRIILLDEADALTSDAQHALRRIIERASSEVRFILTCNYPNKIIEPIRSRCANYYFKPLSSEQMLQITLKLLKENGVEKITVEEKQGLLKIVRLSGGDMRFVINQLIGIVDDNKKLHPEVVDFALPPNLAQLIINHLQNGNWEGAQKLLEDAYINSANSLLLIEQMYTALKNSSLPKYLKIRAFEKLAEVERAIRIGCTPLIQFTSFLASVEVMRYFAKD
ncbi:MAG: AAA family ATPase [Thermoplasmata archaeon]